MTITPYPGISTPNGITHYAGISFPGGITYEGITTQAFDTRTAIPANLTFTRTQVGTNNAWYIPTAGGSWTATTANQPRFHFPPGQTESGLLVEGTVANKMTSRNFNPTDFTGWTLGGDAYFTANAAVVNDPSGYIAGAKLENLATGGKLYRLNNTGGATIGTMTSTATAGTAGQRQTFGFWIAVVAGTVTITRTGAGTPETRAITSSTFARRALLYVTNATTITLTLASTPAGGAGTGLLYYGYAALFGVTYTNLVADNAAVSMPLQGAVITM